MSEWLMSEWAQAKRVPDPPLKNPYMEGIEAIEGILGRLQRLTKEFPNYLDEAQVQDYTSNMLEVRDTFSRLRQQEMEAVS